MQLGLSLGLLLAGPWSMSQAAPAPTRSDPLMAQLAEAEVTLAELEWLKAGQQQQPLQWQMQQSAAEQRQPDEQPTHRVPRPRWTDKVNGVASGGVDAVAGTVKGLFAAFTKPVQTFHDVKHALSHPKQTARGITSNIRKAYATDPYHAAGATVANLALAFVPLQAGAGGKAVTGITSAKRGADFARAGVVLEAPAVVGAGAQEAAAVGTNELTSPALGDVVGESSLVHPRHMTLPVHSRSSSAFWSSDSALADELGSEELAPTSQLGAQSAGESSASLERQSTGSGIVDTKISTHISPAMKKAEKIRLHYLHKMGALEAEVASLQRTLETSTSSAIKANMLQSLEAANAELTRSRELVVLARKMEMDALFLAELQSSLRASSKSLTPHTLRQLQARVAEAEAALKVSKNTLHTARGLPKKGPVTSTLSGLFDTVANAPSNAASWMAGKATPWTVAAKSTWLGRKGTESAAELRRMSMENSRLLGVAATTAFLGAEAGASSGAPGPVAASVPSSDDDLVVV